MRRAQTIAWLIHLYTASGAVFGMLALWSAAYDDTRGAFFYLVIAAVIDGTDGLLAPPGDAAALADALTRLAADAARRAAFARAAAARDRSAMRADAVAARLAAVYDDALALRGAPPVRAPRVDGDDPALETRAASGHAAPSCASSS